MNTNTIYEKTFARSHKTDAILVVQGKRLHVNKAILSYHSDYFKTLFNSAFNEKSMSEIPIKDVNFKDFATLLSLVHQNPILPTEENAAMLLELADRFLLESAKYQLEIFIITTSMTPIEKLKLADMYELDVLLKHALTLYSSPGELLNLGQFSEFSHKTKANIFERQYALAPKQHISASSIYWPLGQQVSSASQRVFNGNWNDSRHRYSPYSDY